MKPYLSLMFALLTFLPSLVKAQGTFIYDQQSSDENNIQLGGLHISSASNPAQSFTPSLSAVQFIRLYIDDNNATDLVGASLLLNLRSNSFDGPVLSSTQPVSLPNGFLGTVNFLFDSPVNVTTGQTYFFDVVLQAGNDAFTANISFYNYSRGQLYFFGAPDISDRDMWFREGIIVPEPSSVSLFLLGGSIATWFACRNRGRT